MGRGFACRGPSGAESYARNAPIAFRGSDGMKGRKRKEESRATVFRQQLTESKQTPKALRPSLRALARDLGTTHQLLSHYLAGIDKWRWKAELERFRAQAKAKNSTLTPAVEKKYLAWLTKIEARQVRDAAKSAEWARKHCDVIDRLR